MYSTFSFYPRSNKLLSAYKFFYDESLRFSVFTVPLTIQTFRVIDSSYSFAKVKLVTALLHAVASPLLCSTLISCFLFLSLFPYWTRRSILEDTISSFSLKFQLLEKFLIQNKYVPSLIRNIRIALLLLGPSPVGFYNGVELSHLLNPSLVST